MLYLNAEQEVDLAVYLVLSLGMGMGKRDVEVNDAEGRVAIISRKLSKYPFWGLDSLVKERLIFNLVRAWKFHLSVRRSVSELRSQKQLSADNWRTTLSAN